MNEPFVNKVAESGLVTIDLETWLPRGEVIVFDLKEFLFMGLILKEKICVRLSKSLIGRCTKIKMLP